MADLNQHPPSTDLEHPNARHRAGLAAQTCTSDYAVLGITHPGTLSAPELVGLLAEWSFVPLVAAIVFMLVLFPSGTMPLTRWRPFAALALLTTALTMAGFVVHPRLIALPAPGVRRDAGDRRPPRGRAARRDHH